MSKSEKHEMLVSVRTDLKLVNKLVELLDEEQLRTTSEEISNMKKEILKKLEV